MQTTPVTSFEYEIQEENGEKYVVIKKFIGSETDVVIPKEIDGLPVREIGEYAFLGRTGLTSVSLPERVKTIEWCAFYKCTGLTEFAVSEKNPNFKSIDGVLFTKDGRELLRCPLGKAGDYTVPKGVKTVRRFAFADCAGLTSVTLPEGVKTIGHSVFYHCAGLISVTLPEGVKTIEKWTFWCCTSLTSVTLPNGLETIGEYAFGYCAGLVSVPLPKGLKTIEKSAFGHCTGLVSVPLPEGLETIGDYAFADCTGLTSIALPESLKELGKLAFSDCTKLKEYSVSEKADILRL